MHKESIFGIVRSNVAFNAIFVEIAGGMQSLYIHVYIRRFQSRIPREY